MIHMGALNDELFGLHHLVPAHVTDTFSLVHVHTIWNCVTAVAANFEESIFHKVV